MVTSDHGCIQSCLDPSVARGKQEFHISNERKYIKDRGGELGVLRVREHPLNVEVPPLTAKSTPSK